MLDFGLEFSEVQSGGYVTVVLVVLTSNLRKSNSGGKKVGGWLLKVANFGLLNSVGRLAAIGIRHVMWFRFSLAYLAMQIRWRWHIMCWFLLPAGPRRILCAFHDTRQDTAPTPLALPCLVARA